MCVCVSSVTKSSVENQGNVISLWWIDEPLERSHPEINSMREREEGCLVITTAPSAEEY